MPQDSHSPKPQRHTGRRQPKIGLALGAGVARGWAHIGILRELEAAGIKADVIAGTSIGAVVGGAWAAGALDPLEAWARSLKKLGMLRFLDFRLRGSGLFGGGKLMDLMMEHFGAVTIESLPLPFTAVACELQTGHEIWLDEGSLVDSIRASFALPGAFSPTAIDGRWLADGALVNPVPVSVCRAHGADLVIAVNLAEDIYGRARAAREGRMAREQSEEDFEIEAESLIRTGSRRLWRGGDALTHKLFAHDKDQPSLFSTMQSALSIMQNRLSRSRLAGEPPDVAIQPRCGHVGLMEFHRADELIEEGRRAFHEALPQIEDALAIIGFRMNGEG